MWGCRVFSMLWLMMLMWNDCPRVCCDQYNLVLRDDVMAPALPVTTTAEHQSGAGVWSDNIQQQ